MRALLVKKYKYNTKSLVERQLPAAGEVTVAVGDIVKGFSKVGECLYSERSQELAFEGDFVKKLGDKVFSNEVVWVYKKGFIKLKEGRAPFSGIISSVDMDKKTFVMKRPQREYSLIAGASGKVKSIVEKRGVLIESKALEVTGVAGKGGDVSGELIVMGGYKDFGGETVEGNFLGKVLVCGYLNSYLYSKAKFFGAFGFICGGVDYGLYKGLPQDPSIIVTTGFGNLPMDPLLFDYLKGVVSRFVVLRPSTVQILIPEEQEPEWAKVFMEGVYTDVTEGQIVQILSQSYFGLTGTVVGFDKAKAKIEVWEKGKTINLLPESFGVIVAKSV